MRKIYFLLLVTIITLLGCREEYQFVENSKAVKQTSKFNLIQMKDIPSVQNYLKERTDDFKISLNKGNAKSTNFGEISENDIIKVEKENGTFYVFIIDNPYSNSNEFINLEVKEDSGQIVQTKIKVYKIGDTPLINGRVDFKNFSGTVEDYDINGNFLGKQIFSNGISDCGNNNSGNNGGGNGGNTGGNTGGGAGGNEEEDCGDFEIALNEVDELVLIDGCGNVKPYHRGAARINTNCGDDSGVGNGSGNGLNDPSHYYFDPNADPFDQFQIRSIRAKNFWISLSYEEKIWSNQYTEQYLPLLENYLDNYQYSPISEIMQQYNQLYINAVSFLIQNKNVSWEQFQNWFMGTSEGKDGEYVDPNLIEYETPIVQQSLPTLAQWYTSFPKIEENGYWKPMESPAVYQLAGGSLYTSHINDTTGNYQNACAIRGSRGLLYSGITIPVIKRSTLQLTQKGGDGKNYILAATTFLKFMKDTFGDTPHKLENADANDPTKVANLLKGKSGIYVIENADPRPTSQGGAGYSGHVDNIVNGICVSGAYTQPKGGVKSIRIWILN